MSEIEKQIRDNLNENGKLNCSTAFKISSKTKTPIAQVGQIAHEAGVRIDACELGQFGKLDKSEYSDDAKNSLKPLLDNQRRVTCKDARLSAAGIGLKMIRGTLAKEKIDVIYCELGCFSEKKRPRMHVKTKTWIENAEGQILFGKGKTQILEAIKDEKSIVGAAEIMGMNYKKAWSHIQVLQKYVDDPLVFTQKGGGDQGGSFLTPKGKEYIEKYRQLQNDIENYANDRFRELFLKPIDKKIYKG